MAARGCRLPRRVLERRHDVLEVVVDQESLRNSSLPRRHTSSFVSVIASLQSSFGYTSTGWIWSPVGRGVPPTPCAERRFDRRRSAGIRPIERRSPARARAGCRRRSPPPPSPPARASASRARPPCCSAAKAAAAPLPGGERPVRIRRALCSRASIGCPLAAALDAGCRSSDSGRRARAKPDVSASRPAAPPPKTTG